MKKLLFVLLLFIFFKGHSQINKSEPWMQNYDQKSNKEITLDQRVKLFNEYWKTHNKNEKGSGYKPFMRWENYWRELTDNEGNIIASEIFWDIWREKQLLKTNKNKSALALPVSNWIPLGPTNFSTTGSWSSGQGRVNYVCVDPKSPNTLYVGTPAGGIWKSINSGAAWTPLSDELPQIGVSGIAVDHINSNTIYIATGDKDGGNSYSIGVLKSTNGGSTWNTTGLSFTGTSSRAGDLIMHPTNNQILWCATKNGIYKTSNAGVAWTVVQAGDFSRGSIRYKTNDPSVILAVTDSKFYRSTNSGDTFTQVTSGIPATSGDLVLDVTAANANYVYVLSTNTDNTFQGIYKSTDAGLTFTKTASTTDIFENKQSGYDLALAVSQSNPEEIFTGCLNVWKSIDGGTTMTKVNNWSSPSSTKYTHADIHFLKFYGNKLYCGSDGGVYVSDNAAATFTSITAGLQISQFYRLSVSSKTATKMVGGLQDNGGYALSNNLWKNYYGADGMDTAIDPNNDNIYYGFIQNGGTLYVSTNAGNSLGRNVGSPGDIDGNWITPLAINKSSELFAGYEKLYKLSGSTWVDQSTTSDLGTGNIEIITIDPSNDNIMYVVNGSKIYKSTNKGVAFTNPYTASVGINSLTVHSSNSNIVYIATTGTTGQVLKSVDGGITFVSISTGLPSISKNIIKHQAGHNLNPLYVGTSLGVYYKDDSMTSWQPFETNLPNVSVRDLEINTIDNKIIAATYGRGIWQSDIPKPNVLSSEEFELENVSISPNPSSGLFNITLGDKPIENIEVFDVSGKKLITISNNESKTNPQTLDITNFANGIYFVKVSADNKKIIKQIIKN
jgi:hypothetical protein